MPGRQHTGERTFPRATTDRRHTEYGIGQSERSWRRLSDTLLARCQSATRRFPPRDQSIRGYDDPVNQCGTFGASQRGRHREQQCEGWNTSSSKGSWLTLQSRRYRILGKETANEVEAIPHRARRMATRSLLWVGSGCSKIMLE